MLVTDISKSEVRVLKYLTKPQSSLGRSPSYVAAKLNMGENTVETIINNLVSENFLKSGVSDGEYRITTEGKLFLEKYRSSILSTVLKSFIIPIIVSVITVLVRDYLFK
ncbi:hypothetical protein [Enterococcus sp. BWR-S5]|uniref:hypothetical protein n=1 Tax=Enterococcus sp. BWR-S5 TaxID=2787714 RepID=UPI001923C1D9|nr:hypothetical protein [Enterococcus sp. BWR-S5]MBL1225406.1 hypothetical protein [Enterococcus sp. BWR-S5]